MLWGGWISAFILHNQGPMLLNFRKLNRRQLDRISQQYLHISVQTVRRTLALNILSNPLVFFLDEPTVGMDI